MKEEIEKPNKIFDDEQEKITEKMRDVDEKNIAVSVIISQLEFSVGLMTFIACMRKSGMAPVVFKKYMPRRSGKTTILRNIALKLLGGVNERIVIFANGTSNDFENYLSDCTKCAIKESFLTCGSNICYITDSVSKIPEGWHEFTLLVDDFELSKKTVLYLTKFNLVMIQLTSPRPEILREESIRKEFEFQLEKLKHSINLE